MSISHRKGAVEKRQLIVPATYLNMQETVPNARTVEQKLTGSVKFDVEIKTDNR